MLEYLTKKREELEEQKTETSIVYEDIERKVDEYRKELYAVRDAEINEKNKLIDAQLAILDEVIDEATKPCEAEATND